MKRYIVLFIFGLLMFALTFFVAFNFFYQNRDNFVSSELEKARVFRNLSENDSVKETSSDEEKIGINTKLIIEQHFTGCNHQKEVVSDLDNNMINLNREMFEKEYPNFSVIEFSKECVKVKETINGICDEHFKIGVGDDFIEVFKLNQEEEEELYMVTSISKDYLAQRDLDKLKNGIEVIGRENINSKLEDYE